MQKLLMNSISLLLVLGSVYKKKKKKIGNFDFSCSQLIGDSTIGNIVVDMLFVILYVPYILRKIEKNSLISYLVSCPCWVDSLANPQLIKLANIGNQSL